MLSESFGHIRNDEAAWKQHGPICWHVVSSYIVLTCSHKISQVVVEPLSPLWSLFSQVICGHLWFYRGVGEPDFFPVNGGVDRSCRGCGARLGNHRSQWGNGLKRGCWKRWLSTAWGPMTKMIWIATTYRSQTPGLSQFISVPVADWHSKSAFQHFVQMTRWESSDPTPQPRPQPWMTASSNVCPTQPARWEDSTWTSHIAIILYPILSLPWPLPCHVPPCQGIEYSHLSPLAFYACAMVLYDTSTLVFSLTVIIYIFMNSDGHSGMEQHAPKSSRFSRFAISGCRVWTRQQGIQASFQSAGPCPSTRRAAEFDKFLRSFGFAAFLLSFSTYSNPRKR